MVFRAPLQRVGVPPAEPTKQVRPVAPEEDGVGLDPLTGPVERAGAHANLRRRHRSDRSTEARGADRTHRSTGVVGAGLVEHRDRAPHVVRRVDSVRVGADEVRASCGVKAVIQPRARTSFGIVDEDDAGVVAGNGLEDVARPVRRTAVDDEHFEVGLVLREQARQAVADVPALLVGRNDHRDPRAPASVR